MGYIHTMDYDLATQSNELWIYVATCISDVWFYLYVVWEQAGDENQSTPLWNVRGSYLEKPPGMLEVFYIWIGVWITWVDASESTNWTIHKGSKDRCISLFADNISIERATTKCFQNFKNIISLLFQQFQSIKNIGISLIHFPKLPYPWL